MKLIYIKFKFKSFSKNNFKKLTPKIYAKVKSLSLINSSKDFASLPIKIQRYTVLRSPHVDKKSREQFEIKTYSKLLTVCFDWENTFEKQKAKLLINFVKNSSAGCNLKITYTF